MEHHDALRLRITRAADGDWTARVAEPAHDPADDGLLTRVPAADLTGEELRVAVARHARAAAADLDPEAGRTLRAVWFDAGPDAPGRLLLTLHHLAIDGVSWGVLLPDLATAWHAVRAGEPVALPPTGTSLRAWATELADRAHDRTRVAELRHWREVLATGQPLPATGPADGPRARRRH